MLAPEIILQDRYRIVRQLGQGGMGAVYEAVDQRLDATVALKETLFVDEKLRKQFEREARLLARLHHPALPRVSDHFAEGEGAFLVMQFIPGDDLAAMFTRRQGPFPVDQVLLWGDQLLDALDYLHTQDPQIIHRDIKPQNLKLSGRGQIILLDFGLAKGQAGELSRATTSASIFGYTPNYAPLEQIQGLGTDPRSDIYALAATLYHLATGVKPPDALTRAAAIVNGQPDPLQRADQVNPAVGSQVAAVLQRAMAQNREQRYASATEMRNALRAGKEETIGIAGDATTVLFPSAPTMVEVANPAARATRAQTSETTVVHAPAQATKGHGKIWAVAAAVLLSSGLAFGGFYAYKHSGGSAPPSSPAGPDAAISPPPAQPSPSSVQITPAQTDRVRSEQKKPERASRDNPRKETAAKEAAVGRNDRPAEPKPSATIEDRRAETKPQPTPNAPANLPARNPDTAPGGRNGSNVRQMPNGVKVISHPDGTRVMIAPNGARRVTFPNGTTRDFPPPGQQRRRQRP